MTYPRGSQSLASGLERARLASVAALLEEVLETAAAAAGRPAIAAVAAGSAAHGGPTFTIALAVAAVAAEEAVAAGRVVGCGRDAAVAALMRKGLLGSDEAIFVAVPILELVEITTAAAPFVEGDLAVLVGVELTIFGRPVPVELEYWQVDYA